MQWLVEYNAALASICFMTLLGFVDDVLDVPWRVWVSSHLCLFCSLSICFSIFLELWLDFISYMLPCDCEEQEITTAIICCSSFVDGLCWAYYYYYTKASRFICGPRDSWSRYGFWCREMIWQRERTIEMSMLFIFSHLLTSTYFQAWFFFFWF